MNAGLIKAYKDGKQDFYGRDFFVTPDVLIPRPETEMMVDAVLNLCGVEFLKGVKPAEAKIKKSARILDVGTGSGCVAVTLKKELPEAEILAVDLSEKALEVAEKNAKNLDADVKFFKSDLMKNVEGKFDVVVANLPYVDKNWDWLNLESLAQEPEIALFAEDGGLKLIFDLILQVKERTEFLVLEADPSQHEKITQFAEMNGFVLLETRGYSLVYSD